MCKALSLSIAFHAPYSCTQAVISAMWDSWETGHSTHLTDYRIEASQLACDRQVKSCFLGLKRMFSPTMHVYMSVCVRTHTSLCKKISFMNMQLAFE